LYIHKHRILSPTNIASFRFFSHPQILDRMNHWNAGEYTRRYKKPVRFADLYLQLHIFTLHSRRLSQITRCLGYRCFPYFWWSQRNPERLKSWYVVDHRVHVTKHPKTFDPSGPIEQLSNVTKILVISEYSGNQLPHQLIKPSNKTKPTENVSFPQVDKRNQVERTTFPTNSTFFHPLRSNMLIHVWYPPQKKNMFGRWCSFSNRWFKQVQHVHFIGCIGRTTQWQFQVSISAKAVRCKKSRPYFFQRSGNCTKQVEF